MLAQCGASRSVESVGLAGCKWSPVRDDGVLVTKVGHMHGSVSMKFDKYARSVTIVVNPTYFGVSANGREGAAGRRASAPKQP